MVMMPCLHVSTTRKERAITYLKEKATVPLFGPGNVEHHPLQTQ